MSEREKILIGITLGSLIVSGITIGLTLRNRQSKADTVTEVTENQTSTPKTNDQQRAVKGETIDISLVEGWNLITVPKYSKPTPVADVFSTITSAIYILDNDQWRQAGSGESVSETGYLLKVSASSTLSIDQADLVDNRSPYVTAVSEGYNLVGNPFLDTTSLPTLLIQKKRYSAREAIDSKFIRLYRWNAGLQKFEKLSGGELLKKHEAFLIQTNDPITLTFIK